MVGMQEVVPRRPLRNMIYVVGGEDGMSVLNSVERYDWEGWEAVLPTKADPACPPGLLCFAGKHRNC